MNFTFNIDAQAKRLFSTANPYIRTISLGTASNPLGFSGVGSIGTLNIPQSPAMLFQFLSTQPSDLIESKSVVSFTDYPRFLTSSANTTPISAQGSATLTSSNLQLNQIPSLIMINVRKPMSSMTIQDSSSFMAINNISINLNNQSGLLSSMSAYDLWRMSVKNGSAQSWETFSGVAQTASVAVSGAGEIVNTTGSLLVINPAYDLSLPDYLSNSSLGSYNFAFQIGVSNTLEASGGASITPEICVITANDGIMVTQQGVSAIYTGILTKEMVLDAKSRQQASAMKSAEIARMVGGNMHNRNLHGIVRQACRRLGGGATSGGATSGGATSGGMKSLC